MILWTIQTEDVYQQLLTDKIYRCDIDKSELFKENCFQNAYNWIIKQMNKQLKTDNAIKYPIWGWYIRDGKHKQPDLRNSGYGETGTKMVCLEVEIPDEEILLSDFDYWHFVLGDYYLGDDEEWFDNLSKEQQEIEKEKSWNKIFDIKKDRKYIQATFFELKLEQIIKVKFFKSR